MAELAAGDPSKMSKITNALTAKGTYWRHDVSASARTIEDANSPTERRKPFVECRNGLIVVVDEGWHGDGVDESGTNDNVRVIQQQMIQIFRLEFFIIVVLLIILSVEECK